MLYLLSYTHHARRSPGGLVECTRTAGVLRAWFPPVAAARRARGRPARRQAGSAGAAFMYLAAIPRAVSLSGPGGATKSASR